MRSEYFPKLALYPEILPLVQNGGDYILQPPSSKELLEIIRYPALAGRMNFEKHSEQTNRDLSDEIHEAALKHPDSLPLLEFTLDELYKKQDLSKNERTLTYSDYAEIGKLEYAIGTRAQNTYENLPNQAKESVDFLFAQLITVKSSGEGLATKAQTSLKVLKSCHPGAELFIQSFQEQNLLITDYDLNTEEITITIAHEALMNNWELFKNWISTHKTQLQARTRLQEQASRYDLAKANPQEKEKKFLLSEANLAEAIRVRDSDIFSLPKELTKFVSLSENKAKLKSRALTSTSILFAAIAIVEEAEKSAEAEKLAKLEAQKSAEAEKLAKLEALKSANAEKLAKEKAEKKREKPQTKSSIACCMMYVESFLYGI